ncbi:DUF4142 domain-containing protein [Ancylobacter lacus]|uniref:DUF4142 domain-containing protein n=1 Tax=Ancylobacter lacus TaxID=2579970 RepID=UPI001BCF438A|nr:DUF4142 domain-containing protein [Ancylobacter lacus]MBS7539096.1 DUF4142 domain-containing protein [Ancylobacter lacus]
MQRRMLMAGAAGLASLTLAPRSFAQPAPEAQPPPEATAAPSAPPAEERALAILMAGSFATASSELVLKRSRDAAVRGFARLEMAEQAAIARAFGSRPGREGLMAQHEILINKLTLADDAAFDLLYLEGQIAGHEASLRDHRAYARTGNQPMARGAAMVAVPGIETHLALLATLSRKTE